MAEPRSDCALLRAWTAGDSAAGGELIDRKHPAIVRFFRNKVAEVRDEADLVQQTFAGLVEGRDTIRNPEHLDAFLYAVARNALRGYIRKRSKRVREGEDYRTLCVSSLPAASPTSIAGLKRDAGHLAECLRKIPLDAQIVLELRFFEGATARTIARLMAIPRGSVDRRVRQGMERLREALEVARMSQDEPTPTPEALERWAAELRRCLPS